MSVLQYLSSEIPSVQETDTGTEVLEIMKEWGVSELALVKEGKYEALIKEEDLLNWKEPGQAIGHADFFSGHPFVQDNDHPYVAVCTMSEADLSLLPVVDSSNKYLGVVTREELFHFFCDYSGLNQPGGIIVLSVAPIDYSLSEIARICENNDTVILNVQLFTYSEGSMDVVLKTGSRDLRGLKASFERYEYTVKEVYGNMPVADDLESRYKLLMNYINM